MAKELEINDELKSILSALASASEPIGNKELETETGIPKSKLPTRVKKLKDAGLVDSPIRCKYGITDAGKGKL